MSFSHAPLMIADTLHSLLSETFGLISQVTPYPTQSAQDRQFSAGLSPQIVPSLWVNADSNNFESFLLSNGNRHLSAFGVANPAIADNRNDSLTGETLNLQAAGGDEPLLLSPTTPTSQQGGVPNFRRVGKADNQANRAMFTDFIRTLENLDGNGITIGVISDSYDLNQRDATNAINDIASGDLPGPGNPFGRLTPVQVLAESSSTGFDEGRALLQLIHDVAPGTKLLFHTANDASGRAFTDRSVANAIRSLAAAGATIIVDNVNGFESPIFQDGDAALAVEEVTSKGITYFTSAANNARNAYDNPFRDAATSYQPGQLPLVVAPANNAPLLGGLVPLPAFRGGTPHDFDPGANVDSLQGFTLGPGEQIAFALQWDNPYYVNGTVAIPPTDLDVYILNADGTSVVGGSAIANDRINQTTGQPVGPIEFVSFANLSQQTNQYNIAIVRANGPTPSRVSYLFNAPIGLPKDLEFATNSPTIFGHKNTPSAIVLGAANYRDTPAFERLVQSPFLERFSSIGGIPILFNASGQRLSQPQIRLKPDLVGPDGVNTTFYGLPDPSNNGRFEKDNLPNFFGTSAAAPNVAAAAALMKQVAPWTTPADIATAMKTTALDMGDPNATGNSSGFDFATGYGYFMGDRAVTLLAYFDEKYYLANNPQVATAVAQGRVRNAFEHFATAGRFEGKDPSARFNSQLYLQSYPDVAEAIAKGLFRSAFDHFIQRGAIEGRELRNLYNETYYLQGNPDISLAILEGKFRTGYEHFILYGQAEGRKVSPFFDEKFYLAKNPTVADAVAKGLYRSGYEHFTKVGQYEGRAPSASVKESTYLQQNPDVAAAVKAGLFRSGMEHFVLLGQRQNRG